MILEATILAILLQLAVATAFFVSRARSKKQQQSMVQQILTSNERFKQDAILASEERNRLLDALGDAFMLVDSNGYIRFANSAARELFGRREIVNRPVREAFLDPRLADSLLRCLATGEPVQSRVVLPQQTSPRGDLENRGVNAWIIDSARLPTPEGSEPTTRVIIRDVTSEHQTEQIRKDFVANASHELRTPMAIINGYLENLLDDEMVGDAQARRPDLAHRRGHAGHLAPRIGRGRLPQNRTVPAPVLHQGRARAPRIGDPRPERRDPCQHAR
jgi:two-component system phosphate regulon sensor histidine kinase PhoR